MGIYEQAFASLVGAPEAIAFAYARTALHSIFTALGLGHGDAVILSPLTCKVVPLVLLSLGVTPVYADIARATLNLDPAGLAAAIRPATHALLFQHTYGNKASVEAVAHIAASRGVPLVEDCAQALPGPPPDCLSVGGVARIYSNNLRKPLPAGSGGMAVTHDSHLAQRIRAMRDGYPRRQRLAEIKLRLEIWLQHHVLRPALYWRFFELNCVLSASYRMRSSRR